MGPGFGVPFGRNRARRYGAFDQALTLPGDEKKPLPPGRWAGMGMGAPDVDPFPLSFKQADYIPGYPKDMAKFEAQSALVPDPRTLTDGIPPTASQGVRQFDKSKPTGQSFSPFNPWTMGGGQGGTPQPANVSNAGAPPSPEAGGFDLGAEWSKLGAPPRRAPVERNREQRFGNILPMIFSGLGDVFAAKGGQRTGHLNANIGMQEGMREGQYREDLTKSDRAFADDSAQYQHNVAGLNMRQRVADSLKHDKFQADAVTRDTKYRDAATALGRDRFNLEKQMADFAMKQAGGGDQTKDIRGLSEISISTTDKDPDAWLLAEKQRIAGDQTLTPKQKLEQIGIAEQVAFKTKRQKQFDSGELQSKASNKPTITDAEFRENLKLLWNNPDVPEERKNELTSALLGDYLEKQGKIPEMQFEDIPKWYKRKSKGPALWPGAGDSGLDVDALFGR